NYTNFNTAIKEKPMVDLRGWPKDIPFQSPTILSGLNTLLKLHNVLKNGSCHWFCMTTHQ
ncbi:uncharacterized protein BJ212DRAFT_1289465, partial [Suillus subaureus]